jgi:general secretion pathway protein E
MIDVMGWTMLGAVPPSGAYFSIFKIIVILVVLLPWLYASTWINKDAVRVHASQTMWSSIALACGIVPVLVWVLVPWFLVGLGLYVAAFGSVLGSYVVFRNKRVVPTARVLTSEHLRSLLVPKKAKKVEVVQRMKLYDNLGRPVFPPGEGEMEQREAYNLTQNFLHNVVMHRASDVDLTPTASQTSVRFVIDGVLQRRPAAEPADAEKVIDYVKAIGGLNVEEKRRPQTGRISMEVGAVFLDGSVTTAGTTHGQRMQLRVVQEAVRTNLDDLGMPDDVRKRVGEINYTDNGLMIVSGQRSNGVTSTMYSLLREHDAFMLNLATLEVSPTVELETITQNKYRDQMDLPGRLASVLRRDPDVVLIDRCDTAQAAQVICEAAARINVLLGVTADSSFKALAKWVKLAGEQREEAMRLLKAILCQVLLRKLCPNCKEPYRPARDLVAKLNLPAEKIEKFYRTPTKPLTDEKGNPIVCPTCRGTGYYGRTAAFELMDVNDEIRQLVCQSGSLSRIKAACRKNKMLYLQEQALRKVIEGVTSIEEVIRVSKTKQ